MWSFGRLRWLNIGDEAWTRKRRWGRDMLCRRMNMAQERSIRLRRRLESRRRLKRIGLRILAMAVVRQWLVCVVFLCLVSLTGIKNVVKQADSFLM